MQRSFSPPILEKENQAQDSSDEPEQHIDQINPYRILHPRDVLVSFRVYLNEQFSKYTKDGCPKDAIYLYM